MTAKKVLIGISNNEIRTILEENNASLPESVTVTFCEIEQVSTIVETELDEPLVIIIHLYEKGGDKSPEEIIEFKKNMQKINFKNFIILIDEVSMPSFMNAIDKFLRFFNERKGT